MNLRRQLLLVSLLTLMLPWAGCEFIRETEIALRAGQQQMLAGTARAVANSLAQYAEEFPVRDRAFPVDGQVYVHELATPPLVDGYFDDWPLGEASLHAMRGTDGPIRFAVGAYGQAMYIFVEVSDRNIVFGKERVFHLLTVEDHYEDGIGVFADFFAGSGRRATQFAQELQTA